MKTLNRDQAIYAAKAAARRAAAQPGAPEYLASAGALNWKPHEWVIDAILTATHSGDIVWTVTTHTVIRGTTAQISGERYGLRIIGRCEDGAADVETAIRTCIARRLEAQQPSDEGGTYWITKIRQPAPGRSGLWTMNPRDNGQHTVFERAEGAPAPTE